MGPADPELEFAGIWQSLPKIVFSNTLEKVEGNARLATDGVAEEVATLKEQPGKDLTVLGSEVDEGDGAHADRSPARTAASKAPPTTSSGRFTMRRCRAGTPAHTSPPGMSRSTTEPMPTMAPGPMRRR